MTVTSDPKADQRTAQAASAAAAAAALRSLQGSPTHDAARVALVARDATLVALGAPPSVLDAAAVTPSPRDVDLICDRRACWRERAAVTVKAAVWEATYDGGDCGYHSDRVADAVRVSLGLAPRRFHDQP